MWGAAYWQYFEDIDKITSFRSTPLSIKKQIMVERVQNNKTVLMPATNLEVGDKVVMRMELKTHRPMDYIHLKDMRAAGLEPINVISQYKYQGGLGYYESTKDLATHFFFDHIVPGTSRRPSLTRTPMCVMACSGHGERAAANTRPWFTCPSRGPTSISPFATGTELQAAPQKKPDRLAPVFGAP